MVLTDHLCSIKLGEATRMMLSMDSPCPLSSPLLEHWLQANARIPVKWASQEKEHLHTDVAFSISTAVIHFAEVQIRHEGPLIYSLHTQKEHLPGSLMISVYKLLSCSLSLVNMLPTTLVISTDGAEAV